MRTWSILPALLLLTACTSEEPLTESDVFVTYLGSALPQSWTLFTMFALLGDEDSCPAVVQDSDTQWTLAAKRRTEMLRLCSPTARSAQHDPS